MVPGVALDDQLLVDALALTGEKPRGLPGPGRAAYWEPNVWMVHPDLEQAERTGGGG